MRRPISARDIEEIFICFGSVLEHCGKFFEGDRLAEERCLTFVVVDKRGWRDEHGAWIRDIGAWDPLAPHLAAAYRLAGQSAQRQSWGPTPPARSMLAQLAAVSSQSGGDDQS